MANSILVCVLIGIRGVFCAGEPAESDAGNPVQPVVVVQGTVSTPDRAERNYAGTVARRVVRWLGELDVPHRVIDDEAVARSDLGSTRVLVLAYNPYLAGDERKAIKAFVQRGGRLVVFYSADSELAGLLGMRLGKYEMSVKGGRWSMIRFTDAAPGHLPRQVLQESRNIRAVYPVREDSKVIAFWETARGELLDDPAIVQSDTGVWMSHVLLDDGDTEQKKEMLLGLIALYQPEVLRSTALRYMETCGRCGKFDSVEQAVQSILKQAGSVGRNERTGGMLDKALAVHGTLNGLFDRRKYPEVIRNSRIVSQLIVEAYGLIQESATDRFRGIWDHTGRGLYPGDWDRTCRLLAEHGVTDILANMAWPGLAHYSSRESAESETHRLYGDQLAQCVKAAHNHGLRVHVWKVCWNLDSARPELVERLKNKGRLQVSDTGQVLNWLCPSHIENLKQEKDSIREIVKNYEVDGIHLDYIRYPSGHYCFCSGCRAGFEKDFGMAIDSWPASVSQGPLKGRYREWRARQITRLVRDVGALVRSENSGIRVSAAVYGKYPTCVPSVGQDWGEWLREGLVDFVCPMNYTTDTAKFIDLAKKQLALPRAGGRVYPGLGVTARESRLGPVQVVDQIVELRRLGASGFVLFDLNRALATEVLPVLSLGLTAADELEASVPEEEMVELP